MGRVGVGVDRLFLRIRAGIFIAAEPNDPLESCFLLMQSKAFLNRLLNCLVGGSRALNAALFKCEMVLRQAEREL